MITDVPAFKHAHMQYIFVYFFNAFLGWSWSTWDTRPQRIQRRTGKAMIAALMCVSVCVSFAGFQISLLMFWNGRCKQHMVEIRVLSHSLWVRCVCTFMLYTIKSVPVVFILASPLFLTCFVVQSIHLVLKGSEGQTGTAGWAWQQRLTGKRTQLCLRILVKKYRSNFNSKFKFFPFLGDLMPSFLCFLSSGCCWVARPKRHSGSRRTGGRSWHGWDSRERWKQRNTSKNSSSDLWFLI